MVMTVLAPPLQLKRAMEWPTAMAAIAMATATVKAQRKLRERKALGWAEWERRPSSVCGGCRRW
jgi:hypothetical protein